MDILIKAGQLILALAILVTVHEFGHYLAARFFKTRVEKFYLFFNPYFSLYKKKIGETEWGIGWLPLGGYVKISGMIDESMDTEQMKQEPQPWEFRSKPAWQRLIIMLGGIIVNLIVGFFIYMMILVVYGKDEVVSKNPSNGLMVGDVLQKYGFQNGDRILRMGEKKDPSLEDLKKGIMFRDDYKFEVQHQDGTTSSITLPEDVEFEIFYTEGMTTFNHRLKAKIGQVVDTLEAGRKGLKSGDVVVAANNKTIVFWDELTKEIKSNKNGKIQLTVSRNGTLREFNLDIDSVGIIGVGVSDDLAFHGLEIKNNSFGLAQSVSGGIGMGINTLNDYVSQMKFVFTKKGAQGLGGFASIGNLFSPTWDWHHFWGMTAFLSFVLAFMNLLPIPALDGGHVLFLLVEMITGKSLPQKFLEYAQMTGVILLLALMLYVNGLDILRIFNFMK